MKRSLSKVFVILVALFMPTLVHGASACSYEEQVELNDAAANVKTSYEYKEDIIPNGGEDADTGELIDIKEKSFDISIANITDKVYVVLTNKVDNTVKEYHYKDTDDGLVTFKQEDAYTFHEYEINVYSDSVNCKGELYRKDSLKVPIVNTHHNMAICKDYPGYYYCQPFLESEEVSMEEFFAGLADYQKTHEIKTDEDIEEDKKGIIEYYKDHALVINIIAGIIVAAGVATTVILVIRKRSRVL